MNNYGKTVIVQLFILGWQTRLERPAFTHTSQILVYTLSVTFVCVCTLIQGETPVHIFVWAKPAIPNMLISNILLIIYSLLSKFKFLYCMLSTSPVSYTHLDVYKRQIIIIVRISNIIFTIILRSVSSR